MSRDVADEQVEMMLIERAHQAEIASDGAHRMKVGVDSNTAPYNRLWRKALLNTSSQCQILFNFQLTLAQERVCIAKLRFGSFLFGNIRQRDNDESTAIGILDPA